MTLRKRTRTRFTTVDNEAVADKRLSLKAKGLVLYLMSKPDGWRIASRSIASENADGRDSILSAITELLERGYATRYTERDENGQLRTITEVADFRAFPEQEKAQEIGGEEPASGFTESGFSGPGGTESGEAGRLVNTVEANTVEQTPPSTPPRGEEGEETQHPVHPKEKELAAAQGLGMGGRRQYRNPAHKRGVEWAAQVRALECDLSAAVVVVDELLAQCGDLAAVNALPDSPAALKAHEKAKDAALNLIAMGVRNAAQVKVLAKAAREHFEGPVSYGGIMYMAKGGAAPQMAAQVVIQQVEGDMPRV